MTLRAEIGPISSSTIASTRLRSMKEQDVQSNKIDVPERICNPYPADNNKFWNGNHNKLSSKGD